MYNQGVQEVEKHYLHDLGASPQHEACKEDYEEGSGENDRVIDLQNFKDDEKWLVSLLSGQLEDLE